MKKYKEKDAMVLWCYSSLREEGQLSAEEAGKKAKKVNTHCKICGHAYCLICYNKSH